MSDEIYWLTWNVVLTAAMVIPYALYRMKKLGGIFQVFLTPLPGDSPFDDEWAHRAYRAHMNGDITVLACATYFWARLVYAPLYYFDVPILKTTTWFIGLGATLVLAYELLK